MMLKQLCKPIESTKSHPYLLSTDNLSDGQTDLNQPPSPQAKNVNPSRTKSPNCNSL